MATWTEIEGMTWDQLEVLSWHQLERISGEQAHRYVDEIWPLLSDLATEDRRDLVEGLVNGTLPVLVADGETRFTRAQTAALELWQKYKPDNSAATAK